MSREDPARQRAQADAANSKRVGFIGVGHMGGAMALRLIDAGYDVVVCDPDRRACEGVEAKGARVAPTPREVADGAPVVFACLPSCEASLAVALGEDGVIAGSSIVAYVETSTVGQRTVKEIDRRLSARGIGVVDCPVSGGPRQARVGRLTMIASAAPAALAQVRSQLDAIAGKLFVVGEQPGLGQTCKLVNNAMSLAGMAIACEAAVVGVKAGLDAYTLIDVINASSGRNSATADKFPASVLPRTFDYGGPLGLAVKDLRLFIEESSSLGVPAWVTHASAGLWEFAASQGDPGRDFTTLIQTIEQWAGVEVGYPRGER